MRNVCAREGRAEFCVDDIRDLPDLGTARPKLFEAIDTIWRPGVRWISRVPSPRKNMPAGEMAVLKIFDEGHVNHPFKVIHRKPLTCPVRAADPWGHHS